MPTKLEVLYNGEPLAGAVLIIGELVGQEKTTDEEGKVALPSYEAGYRGWTEVVIKSPVYAIAKVEIVYDETTTIDLGDYGEEE